MLWVLVLVAAIIWAVICVLIAKKSKRNMELAGFLGLVFGILAVIAYAIAYRIKK